VSCRVADQLFLTAHDHDTGHLRPRLHRAGLELGLAGALLAELVMDRRIDVRDGRVVVVNRTPVDDILSHTILGDIVTELQLARQPHPVRVWLLYLSYSAIGQIRNRLTFNGILEEVASHRWWGGTANRYRATDTNQALGPEGAVYSMLVHEGAANTVNPVDATAFAVLADASGLLPKLTWWREQRAGLRHRLIELRDQLPPALRELADQTEAAVGDAVASRR
jgi:Golgi phosphoprotein 3 (GPP34)